MNNNDNNISNDNNNNTIKIRIIKVIIKNDNQ